MNHSAAASEENANNTKIVYPNHAEKEDVSLEGQIDTLDIEQLEVDGPEIEKLNDRDTKY